MRAEIELDLPTVYMAGAVVEYDVTETTVLAEPYSWGGTRGQEVERHIQINTIMGKSPKDFEAFFGPRALRQVVSQIEGSHE